MNPRILSNWPILVYRRMMGRRSVVWGHAWGRAGANSKTFLARITMMRLANAILVYTEREQAQLAARTSTPVFVAPNAVVSVDHWSSGYDGNPLNAVIVGRLVPAKKPALAMEAWLGVCGTLDSSARLVFVGDGPARKALEAKAAGHKYGDRVRFMGEVTDRKTLDSVYADAFVTISPGYAGLSLTDSLGYGVPMLIADREPHAPEIALATEANSRFFTAGSSASLGQGILQFYRDRASWFAQRADIASPVRRAYSIEAMVDGFLAAAEPHSLPGGR
jgi:glycosyltransferase involved in cell wall biosynthesis